MNNYKIIKLENNDQYVIIDYIDYEGRKIFLLTETINNQLNDDYVICEYDEINNSFKELEDPEGFISEFNNRLQNKQQSINYYERLKEDLIRVQVENIDSSIYTLKDDRNNKVEKTILLIDEKININDYIYMPKSILDEDNIFTYGKIYNNNCINQEEIIIIENQEKTNILQRYYG